MSYLVRDHKVTWVCDRCGKERNYLSESWHQVYVPTFEKPEFTLHYCVECMSDKQEWIKL